MFLGDNIDLFLHFLDLIMRESLHTEVVILSYVVFDKLSLACRVRHYVTIHNLIARKFEQIQRTDSVVSLVGRSIEPLLNKFGKFIICCHSIKVCC